MPTTISRKPRATKISGVTDYQGAQADAAEDDDFLAWQRARRAEEAWRKDVPAGESTGLINGIRARDQIGSPEQIAARNPVLPVGSGAAGDPEQVRTAAERIGITRRAEQNAADSESLARYRSFLQDSGIDPDSIGSGRMGRNDLGKRALSVTPLAVESAARELMENDQGQRAQVRVAARKLERNRDYEGAQNARMFADRNFPIRTPNRSASGNLQYWIDKIRPPKNSSNGFAGF